MSVFTEIVLPTVLFETTSKLSGKVSVVEKGHTRKLIVNGVTQSVNASSPNAKRMCFGKVVDVIFNSLEEPHRVLLLGLGGGTIPRLLAERFPGIYIVSVELDPVVADIARKYFDVESIPNHRIIVDDALRVVTSPEEFGLSPEEFDVVITDIFVGEHYPELGNSGSFFAGVKRFLIPGGLAVFNRIYLKHHQDDVNNFIENVSDHFRDVKSLIVAGKTNSDNVIIYGHV